MRYFLFLIVFALGCQDDSNRKVKDISDDSGDLFINSVRRFDVQREKLILHNSTDLLDVLNMRFIDTVVKYKNQILEIRDPKELPVSIAIAEDRDFGIVSWNTYTGGTMQIHMAVALFKTSEGIKYKNIGGDMPDSLCSYFNYDTIATLYRPGHTVYLARGYGRGSTALLWECVYAFTITQDSLTEPEIFPSFEYPAQGQLNNTSLSANIFTEFDMHYWDNSIAQGKRQVTLFLDSANTLMVPKIKDNGGNTGSYSTIRFNGTCYELSSAKSN